MKRLSVALVSLALFLSSFSSQAESLRDIYELALENDAQLKAEEAVYLAGKEAEILGRAALLPQVTGSYSYQDTETDTDSLGPIFQADGSLIIASTTSDRDTETEGFQFSLSQAIFDLPAWFGFKSGRETSREAAATFAANQQNLIVRVVDTYLGVLRARDNLAASRAQERAFERQLEQTQQRFEVGLIAITDVYEAQAARDLAQVSRIVDENNLSVALERLSVLTGQRHDNLNILRENFDINPPDPADRSAWVDFALANNFSLQASRHREEAARQTSRANKAEHLPRVSGNYSYSDFDTDGSSEVNPPSRFNSDNIDSNSEESAWGVTLSVPIFTGGAVSANRRRTAQEFNAARQNRINLTRNTVTNTRSLHMTVMSDVSRVAARKQSIVSSRSALDATQAGYEVGTRNVVDVLNAQNSLFSAQRDYANSRYDYVLSMMRLKEAAGLLSPEDIIALDGYMEAPAPPTASTTP